MHNHQGGCYCTVGSMTQALRAQKLLTGAAIRAQIVKTSEEESRRGCAYALSYSCAQENNVRTILQNARLRVRGYHGGKNGLS